jgi:hypothetical protein
MPGRAKVRAAFAARPRAVDGSYAARWDTWLLPRVSGAYTGKTDEIFQWAACKWGLPDNLLRAIAVRESTWYQYPTYTSGACVVNWGCGDIFDAASESSLQYCDGIAKIGGYDYQHDFRTARSRSTATRPHSRSTTWAQTSVAASRAGSGGWCRAPASRG